MDRLRTLGIVAHIDAGKTTLTERILFDAGVQRWCGEVDDGTATMDWMRQEQERGISIVAAATRVPWGGHELQIVDTPGHVDFTAEVERCLRVLDSVVVVLDGVRGVESQTVTVWRQADRWRCARLVFVNKMDRVGADFPAALRALAARFSCRPVAVTVPLFDHRGAFAGLGDAIRGRALWFGDAAPDELPPLQLAALGAAREAVLEACADVDEALFADFVAGRAVQSASLLAALRRGCIAGTLVPVACGSALHNQGVDWLLDAICDFLPSPVDRAREGLEAAFPPADPAAPLSALVFKVEHEGDEIRNYLRVFAGTLRLLDRVVVARSGVERQVADLWAMHSSHHEGVAAALPGEIVVLPGALAVQTGDTLHAPGHRRDLPMPAFPPPVVGALFEPATLADAEPMHAGLLDLQADDPTLRVERDPETGLPLVLGMGELHLEIVAARLRERSGSRFLVSRPRVAQRAACRKSGEGRATVLAPGVVPPRHAEVAVAVAPLPGRNEARVDVGPVAGHPAAAALARELAARSRTGLVHGLPADGVEITVLAVAGGGGGEGDEALVLRAADFALDKALAAAEPVRLEPAISFEVRCPAEHGSAVLADLAARGAQVRQVSSGQLGAVVQGRGRLAAFLGYATRLRSLTRGQGEAQLQPDGYEPAEPAASGAPAAGAN